MQAREGTDQILRGPYSDKQPHRPSLIAGRTQVSHHRITNRPTPLGGWIVLVRGRFDRLGRTAV
jgi:hypothetical protein